MKENLKQKLKDYVFVLQSFDSVILNTMVQSVLIYYYILRVSNVIITVLIYFDV